MENQSTKKKSLFSQRIKQARGGQNPLDNSFPKAVKIDVKPQIVSPQQQFQSQTGHQRFVDKLLGQVLKQEQIEQIQRQNMNSISQMSEQEILKYQQLIMKQISPALIQKLKQGKSNGKKSHKNPQNIQSKNLKVPINEMKDQCQEERERQKKGASEKIEQSVNIAYNEIGSLQKLMINIKTNKLEHTYFELANQEQNNIREQKIRIRQLKLMLESQNNQTQIVGSKILVKLCEQIVKASQHTQMIEITHAKYHALMLCEDIYNYLIKSLMFQIKKTHFKSCWLEMITSFIKCCKILQFHLTFIENGSKFKQISQFLGHQEKKSKMFLGEGSEMQEQNKVEVGTGFSKQELQKIIKYYNEFKIGQLNNTNIENMDGKQMVEQIMIQELESGNKRNSYKFRTLLEQIGQNIIRRQNKDRERCRNEHKLYTFQNMDRKFREYIGRFLYPICLHIYSLELKSNKLNPEVPVMKQVIWNWFIHIIACDIHSFITMDMLETYMKNEEAEHIIFQYLFFIRTLSQTAYHNLLLNKGAMSQTQVQVNNDRLANLLTLLNINEYFHPCSIKSEEKGKEIQNIQKLMVFLTKNLQHDYLRQISSILFVDLMVMFTNYLEYKPVDKTTQQLSVSLSYQDLNENVIESLYIQLVQVILESNGMDRMWELISQQKLKSLIQSYNYNSFGNYTFTKLIAFLLAASTNANTIEMIFDQVIARYPFLFYYAAEHGLYGPIHFYLNAVQVPSMKTIYDILNVAGKAKPDNMFVRYLKRI